MTRHGKRSALVGPRRVFFCRTVLLSLLAGLCVPQHAGALTWLDGLISSDSWSVRFSQEHSELWQGNTVGSYDYVEVEWVSGALLEASGLRDYTNAMAPPEFGQTSTFSAATGPSTPHVEFSMMFEGSRQETSLRYFVYDSDELRQAQLLTLGGDGRLIASEDLMNDVNGRFTFGGVPEPGTLVILTGVGLVGLIRRRLWSRRS